MQMCALLRSTRSLPTSVSADALAHIAKKLYSDFELQGVPRSVTRKRIDDHVRLQVEEAGASAPTDDPRSSYSATWEDTFSFARDFRHSNACFRIVSNMPKVSCVEEVDAIWGGGAVKILVDNFYPKRSDIEYFY